MVTWVAPRTWATLEQITATLLNQELRDQLLFLKTPPKSLVTIRNGTTLTTTSTTIVAVDDAQFTLQLVTFGGDIEIWFLGSILNASGSTARFDVLMDGTTYLSSLTGTNLSGGLVNFGILAGGGMNASFRVTITGQAAGSHDFKLRYWTSAGTLSLVMTNAVVQFGAIER